jgi:hypothetical protein
MVEVVSPYLAAAGAAWDDGPAAAAWIAPRLGPFGPSVGHAVPNDYPAYAIVEIPWDAEIDVPDPALTFEALFDVLESFTGRPGGALRDLGRFQRGWPEADPGPDQGIHGCDVEANGARCSCTHN